MHSFHVPSMSCGGCAGAIKRAFQQVDPNVKVDIDISTKTVKVTGDMPRDMATQTLISAGYPSVE
jgi:copper chaperone